MSLSDPVTDQLRYGELTTTDRDDVILRARDLRRKLARPTD